MNVPLEALHVMDVVRQHHHAPLREHDVVIQFLGQPFPQLHGMFVERGAFVIEIIGPDDGRIAARIAAAKPTFVDHRDVGDAMFLGKIIGGAQPMPARTHDNDVIFSLRF